MDHVRSGVGRLVYGKQSILKRGSAAAEEDDENKLKTLRQSYGLKKIWLKLEG